MKETPTRRPAKPKKVEVDLSVTVKATHTIGDLDRALLRELFGPPRNVSHFATVNFPRRGILIKGLKKLNIDLKPNEPFGGSLKFFDEADQPASVETVTYESSQPGVVITADPNDATKFTGVADSVDSDAIITATADANLNPDITENIVLAGTVFTRHDPKATHGEIEFHKLDEAGEPVSAKRSRKK